MPHKQFQYKDGVLSVCNIFFFSAMKIWYWKDKILVLRTAQHISYCTDDGLVQNWGISTANTLEIPKSCPKPSTWSLLICYEKYHIELVQNCDVWSHSFVVYTWWESSPKPCGL